MKQVQSPFIQVVHGCTCVYPCCALPLPGARAKACKVSAEGATAHRLGRACSSVILKGLAHIYCFVIDRGGGCLQLGFCQCVLCLCPAGSHTSGQVALLMRAKGQRGLKKTCPGGLAMPCLPCHLVHRCHEVHSATSADSQGPRRAAAPHVHRTAFVPLVELPAPLSFCHLCQAARA